jgi:hypothetical protein
MCGWVLLLVCLLAPDEGRPAPSDTRDSLKAVRLLAAAFENASFSGTQSREVTKPTGLKFTESLRFKCLTCAQATLIQSENRKKNGLIPNEERPEFVSRKEQRWLANEPRLDVFVAPLDDWPLTRTRPAAVTVENVVLQPRNNRQDTIWEDLPIGDLIGEVSRRGPKASPMISVRTFMERSR